MIQLNIAGEKVDVKFNFRALFRANQKFSSQKGANDGASNIWVSFVTDDDMALFNALRCLVPDAYDDEHIMELLDDADDAGKLDELHDQVEQELFKSSFFRHAAQRWIDFTEKYGNLQKKAETDEEKIRIKAQRDTLAAMKKSVS